MEAGTGRSQQVKVADNGALGGYKEGYVNAHTLTNAAGAAVYVLSTRTGARRPRIGRRLSVDDRRFDGRFGVPVHTFAWAEAQQGAMPAESMVCNRGRSHAVDWSARAAIGSSSGRREEWFKTLTNSLWTKNLGAGARAFGSGGLPDCPSRSRLMTRAASWCTPLPIFAIL